MYTLALTGSYLFAEVWQGLKEKECKNKGIESLFFYLLAIFSSEPWKTVCGLHMSVPCLSVRPSGHQEVGENIVSSSEPNPFLLLSQATTTRFSLVTLEMTRGSPSAGLTLMTYGCGTAALGGGGGERDCLFKLCRAIQTVSCYAASHVKSHTQLHARSRGFGV